jgi:hypothetical protein
MVAKHGAHYPSATFNLPLSQGYLKPRLLVQFYSCLCNTWVKFHCVDRARRNCMCIMFQGWTYWGGGGVGPPGQGGGLFFMIKQKIIRDKMRYSNLSDNMMIISKL